MRSAQILKANEPFSIVEIDVPEPPAGHVRVKVEACGVCHSDSFTVTNGWPGITFPRAPGHEIAGRIDALGTGVTTWSEGERVGIGWHGGHCGVCERCRRGDFITCVKLQVPGISYDGGYAEYTIVPAVALARLPEELSAAEAGPLLCAGITTFNSLRHSAAGPGDLVGILGLGGLGHLAVQYAAKMGFNVVAIARGAEKEELAKKLGARRYIDSNTSDVGAELTKLGGAKVVLSTVTSAKALEPIVGGLGIDGQLLIVGAAHEPLPLMTMYMIGGRKSVKAWPSGTNTDSEDTLNFSVLTGVRAMIETRPLDKAQEAYDKMMSGDARFRMVIVP